MSVLLLSSFFWVLSGQLIGSLRAGPLPSFDLKHLDALALSLDLDQLDEEPPFSQEQEPQKQPQPQQNVQDSSGQGPSLSKAVLSPEPNIRAREVHLRAGETKENPDFFGEKPLPSASDWASESTQSGSVSHRPAFESTDRQGPEVQPQFKEGPWLDPAESQAHLRDHLIDGLREGFQAQGAAASNALSGQAQGWEPAHVHAPEQGNDPWDPSTPHAIMGQEGAIHQDLSTAATTTQWGQDPLAAPSQTRQDPLVQVQLPSHPVSADPAPAPAAKGSAQKGGSAQKSNGFPLNWVKKADDLGGTVQQVVMFLAIALVIFFIMMRFSKKNMGSGLFSGQKGKKLRIAETRMLGNKQFLVVVEYESQSWLLGVTPQSMSLLTRLDDPEIKEIQEKKEKS